MSPAIIAMIIQAAGMATKMLGDSKKKEQAAAMIGPPPLSNQQQLANRTVRF